MSDDNDQLTTGERRALDAWTPLPPPAGFADRVLAARTVPVARKRWPIVAGGLVAVCAAAAALAIVMRDPSQAASGELVTTERTTASLGQRATAVVEAESSIQWRIAGDGAASINQTTGDVFYRVERGGPFVVHTPAGDVTVLGTCFRVEVSPMNKKHVLLSGTAGAALAAAIVITVYEGHVVADTSSSQTDLRAGTRALIGPDGRATVASLDEPIATTLARSLAEDKAATREELIARTSEQRAELVKLRARLAKLEDGPRDHRDNTAEPGRAWYDVSPERLKEWVADCHVRADSPGLDQFAPFDAKDSARFGIEPSELPVINATMSDLASQWRRLVRSLYIETTGDLNGADVLSVDAMAGEIREKSGAENDHNTLLQKISAERAGLAKPPVDLSKTTPYERLMRAQLEQGNDTEAALAKKLGPERAKALRGDGWPSRSDWSGCPHD